MLKRLSSPVFLLLALVLLSAMGGKGTGFERVPRVEKNYPVTVTDTAGTRIEGDKFSWEGRLRFSGFMGMAEVNVPFEKIREVSIGDKHDRKVRVTAHLTDGSSAIFDVDADSRCYGESGFGSFMYLMSEIKTISFRP